MDLLLTAHHFRKQVQAITRGDSAINIQAYTICCSPCGQSMLTGVGVRHNDCLNKYNLKKNYAPPAATLLMPYENVKHLFENEILNLN